MSIVLKDAQFTGSLIDGRGEHRLQLVNTVTGSVLWVVLEDSEQTVETLEAFLGGTEKTEGVIRGISSYEEEDNTPKSKAQHHERPSGGARDDITREAVLLEQQAHIAQDLGHIRTIVNALVSQQAVGDVAAKRTLQARVRKAPQQEAEAEVPEGWEQF